jgi:hypothetical protein
MQRYKDLGAEEVEAAVLTKENARDLAVMCHGLEVEEQNPFSPDEIYVGINVPTPDGKKRASEGDILVRNYKGEFRVLRPHTFHARYEEIRE